MSIEHAGSRDKAATDAILADLKTAPRGVVVDSPPGAGKSTLVVRAAVELASAGEPVMVVAQTNTQVDDLVDRLAVAAPGLLIGRLSGQDYAPAPQVARHGAAVVVSAKVRDVYGCHIVAGTAAKWAMTGEGLWRWAVIDEAYQMRSDLLLRVACRFRRALFVGDPGQLDPFSTFETERWTGLAWDPMLSAVAVLLRNNPDLPVRQLPVSWRRPSIRSLGSCRGQGSGPCRSRRGCCGPGRSMKRLTWRPGRGGRCMSCPRGTRSGLMGRRSRLACPW